MNVRAFAITLPLLMTCAFVTGQESHPRKALDWEAPSRMMIATKNGPLVTLVQTNRGPLMFSGNRRGPEIKCVFVPTNGLVWIGRVGCSHFCVFNDEIVGFQGMFGNHLSAASSRERVPLTKTGVEHVKDDWQRGEDMMFKRLDVSKRIDLNTILGEHAFIPAGDARVPPAPQITSISVTDKECRLGLQGLNGAKAELVLDIDLNPVSATLNGKKAFERASGTAR